MTETTVKRSAVCGWKRVEFHAGKNWRNKLNDFHVEITENVTHGVVVNIPVYYKGGDETMVLECVLKIIHGSDIHGLVIKIMNIDAREAELICEAVTSVTLLNSVIFYGGKMTRDAAEILSLVLPCIVNLRSFQISNVHFDPGSMECLHKALRGCARLEEVRMWHPGYSPERPETLDSMVRGCRNLKTLEITSETKTAPTLDLGRAIRQNKSIVNLHLDMECMSNAVFSGILWALAERSNMVSIELYQFGLPYSDAEIAAILAKNQSLEYFGIDGKKNTAWTPLFFMEMSHHPTLRSFSCSFAGFTPEQMATAVLFIKSAPRLRAFWARNITPIYGISPELQRLITSLLPDFMPLPNSDDAFHRAGKTENFLDYRAELTGMPF